jgi:hypothetical protein
MYLKLFLILFFVITHVILFGQTNNQIKGGCFKLNKTDSLLDVIAMPFKMYRKTNKVAEKGSYKVSKIDILPESYLIFVEKNDTRYTIYSEKSIITKGIKVEVDSTYFFELMCNDTLPNGICIPSVPHVTYFGKYLGSEIGKLSTAKNLIGLIIPERINMETEH